MTNTTNRLRRMSVVFVAALVLLAAGGLTTAAVSDGASGHAAGKKAKSGYYVDIRTEFAGGRRDDFRVGDLLVVTLKARGHRHDGERYDLTWTPAPVDRSSVYTGKRVNGGGAKGSPSEAGLTKLRFELESGRVITRPIRVRHAH